jgi:hypothetical protein
MAPQSSTAQTQRGPTSGVHQAIATPKPLLASEVLREELAPLEPARHMCRLWLLAVAACLTALSVGMRLGIGLPGVRLDAATVGFSAAGAVAAIAILPFPYALRAGLVVLVGGALAALGLRGAGPLAALGAGGATLSDATRVLMLATLPAALLFRARYRAFTPARVLLAVAVALSLPFVGFEVAEALSASTPVMLRVAGGANVVLVGLGLFGFMGAGSTGAGSLWASLVLVGAPAEIALRQLTPLGSAAGGWLTFPAAAVGVLAAAVLVSLGLFQLLAAALAPAARRGAAPLKRPDDEDSAVEHRSKLS